LQQIAEFIAHENPCASLVVSEFLTASADGLIDFPQMGKPWFRESRKLVLQNILTQSFTESHHQKSSCWPLCIKRVGIKNKHQIVSLIFHKALIQN